MIDSLFIRSKIGRYLTTALVAVIGIILSLVMAIALHNVEKNKAKEQFNYRSEEYATLIYHHFKTHLAVLDSLVAFYTASEKVERQEFNVFTTSILARYPGIKALNWVPRVTLAERATYEAEARKDFPDFQFRELNSQQEWVVAQSRPEYFPLYYAHSQQNIENHVLGFDLASEPKRLQAMIQARDSGRAIMTQPLKSLQFAVKPLASLVFIPVYETKRPVPNSLEQRRQHLRGFMLGVFFITEIVKEALSSIDLSGIDLKIEDLLTPLDERTLYAATAGTLPLSSYFSGFSEPLQVVHQREIAGRPWTFTFTLISPRSAERAGSLFPLISLTSGLILTSLVVAYLLLLVRQNDQLKEEIHQRKEIETELQEAKQYAELVTQTKSDFLIKLSQEMRSPLNNILDTTRFLFNSPLNSEQKQQAKLLNTSSNLLLRLINDISDISKIESGTLQLEQKPFHLLETIQRVLSLSRYIAEEKKLILNLRYHSALPTYVNGDSHRFQQILAHLVNNAIKFSLNGGSIIIEIKAEFQDSTEIMLYITIVDSGVGIDPERHERIFGTFEKEGTSVLQHFSDVGGLGLVICRRLIEKMGGNIGVISKKDQGATFWFSVPFTVAEEQPLITTLPEEELTLIDLSRLRILLVEDNATNRMVTCLMLRKMGCQTIEIAQNGEEAVTMTTATHYDLVLMDIHMPVMDGLYATQLIRQREYTEQRKHLLIVALTADTTPESRSACFFAGTDDYLTKPFCQKDLLSTLYRWLL